MHVAALAASLTSVRCGPPDVSDPDSFAACLQVPGSGWLRATAYHESVAGMLDAVTLDRIVRERPVRVQHRSGRMWFFNSAGLDLLLANHPAPAGLERDGDRYTGRLFDADAWLQQALGSEPPSRSSRRAVGADGHHRTDRDVAGQWRSHRPPLRQ
jgi:predicted amidohydrolase YtcJ